MAAARGSALAGSVDLNRIVPATSSQRPPSHRASAAIERSRDVVVAAMPSQQPTTTPVRLSNSSTVGPRSTGFQALRRSPRLRAVSGSAGERSEAPRGVPSIAPMARLSEPA
jgi:hypothetical protein